MLNITNKTTRGKLILEIEGQRIDAKRVAEEHAKALENLGRQLDEQLAKLRDAENERKNLEHKCAVLETDVHNLLGALRVMADSSRVVRIRSKSIKSAEMATGLPYRNTDTL